MKMTRNVRAQMQADLDELVAAAKAIAERHNVGVRAVMSYGIAAVSGAHLGPVDLDFIPVGDA